MKNLKPITRREMFMAKAAGQDVTPPEPITREEMFLSDIAEHEEGQGGLPAVTSDDNGDVLTVVEGAWAKAASSATGILEIMLTLDLGTNQWSSDLSFAEILSAYESGAFLYAVSNSGDVYTLTYIDNSECTFTNMYHEDSSLYGLDLNITSEGVTPNDWSIVSAGS